MVFDYLKKNNSLVYLAEFALILLLFQFVLVDVLGNVFLLYDDLVVVFVFPIFILELFKNENFRVLRLSLFLILAQSVLFLCIDFNIRAHFLDLVWLLKPIIIFWVCYSLFSRWSNTKLKLYLRFFRLVFIVSLLYGVLQFISWVFFGVELPMTTFKMMTGLHELTGGSKFDFLRVSSIYAHPIWFGLVCSLFGTFFFYEKKYGIFLLCILGILLSFSRWALFLQGFSIAVIILRSAKSKTSWIAIGLFAFFVLVFLIMNIPVILEYYDTFWGGYNQQALKMYGIKKAIELFTMNPFGYGLGTFGTINSQESYVYNLIYFDEFRFRFLQTAKSGIESIWFIILIQLGITGLFFYIWPFLNLIKIGKRSSVFVMAFLLLPLISIIYIPSYLVLLVFFIILFDRQETVSAA